MCKLTVATMRVRKAACPSVRSEAGMIKSNNPIQAPIEARNTGRNPFQVSAGLANSKNGGSHIVCSFHRGFFASFDGSGSLLLLLRGVESEERGG